MHWPGDFVCLTGFHISAFHVLDQRIGSGTVYCVFRPTELSWDILAGLAESMLLRRSVA